MTIIRASYVIAHLPFDPVSLSFFLRTEGGQMGYPQLAVIAVDTTRDLNLLKPIHRMEFMKETEIHLVHAVRQMDYNDGISFNPSFPLYQDTGAIKDAVIAKLRMITPDILPYQHIGKVKYECLFGIDPKMDFCHYLEVAQADLVIIAAREKHGFFDSSFTTYISRHAACNVLVIKSSEKK